MPQTITLPAGRAGFTPAEVAASLAISRAQVYVLLDRGELASFHIGNSCRITADSLAAYIERQLAAEATRPRKRVGVAKTTQTSAEPAA